MSDKPFNMKRWLSSVDGMVITLDTPNKSGFAKFADDTSKSPSEITQNYCNKCADYRLMIKRDESVKQCPVCGRTIGIREMVNTKISEPKVE